MPVSQKIIDKFKIVKSQLPYIIPGWMSITELLALHGLAEQFDLTNQHSILEIGSFLGRSAALWGYVLERNSCSRVICVDPWNNKVEDFPEAALKVLDGNRELIQWGEPTLAQFIFNTRRFNNIMSVPRASRDFIWNFADRPSIVFIDGDHSNDGLHSDLTSYHNGRFGATPNTLLVCHDYGNIYMPHIKDMLDTYAVAMGMPLHHIPNTMLAVLAKPEAKFKPWW
jgi:hypothetical protein